MSMDDAVGWFGPHIRAPWVDGPDRCLECVQRELRYENGIAVNLDAVAARFGPGGFGMTTDELRAENERLRARIEAIEARAAFESTALNVAYRRGFNNAMGQIRAALSAAPKPQRRAYTEGDWRHAAETPCGPGWGDAYGGTQ